MMFICIKWVESVRSHVSDKKPSNYEVQCPLDTCSPPKFFEINGRIPTSHVPPMLKNLCCEELISPCDKNTLDFVLYEEGRIASSDFHDPPPSTRISSAWAWTHPALRYTTNRVRKKAVSDFDQHFQCVIYSVSPLLEKEKEEKLKQWQQKTIDMR